MSTKPNVALCYIRLSMTKTQDDENSPERQKANCLEYCQFRGWEVEFYEDREGHKSGTKETNRPGWLALKNRVADPDIVAVVANDLSRFHRKGFRMGQLVELCKEGHLELVKAGDKKSIDVNDLTATMWVMMESLFNEYYAEDISRKQRDSVRYRRANGIAVGRVPFGTIRPKRDGKSSFLERSPYGVWLLPDGRDVEGESEKPPMPDAVWRGYFDAAERAMRLFAVGQSGLRRLAELLNEEGFRFRDVKGKPRLFDRESIRNIIANWPEYGGALLGSRATKRNARSITPETVTLNPERAVMDIELCYRVGVVRSERFREKTQSKPDTGARAGVRPFPLSRIACCAHCEELAAANDNPSLSGHLIGYDGTRSPRYRHSERLHKCDSRNKSVKAEVLEHEFSRLIGALTIRPDVIPQMVEQLSLFNQQTLTEDRRAEMVAEISLCHQRIRNAEKLFMMARIDEDTLKKHITENEGQIAHLQAAMSEEGQVRQMVEITANMLLDMGARWHEANTEDKQAFAQTLFSKVVFDLDTHQIRGFELKAWAAQFLQVSAAQNGAVMWLKGFQHTGLLTAAEAMERFLELLNAGRLLQCKTREKRERNAKIFQRYIQGEDSVVLGHAYGLSDRRVRSIINQERKHDLMSDERNEMKG